MQSDIRPRRAANLNFAVGGILSLLVGGAFPLATHSPDFHDKLATLEALPGYSSSVLPGDDAKLLVNRLEKVCPDVSRFPPLSLTSHGPGNQPALWQ